MTDTQTHVSRDGAQAVLQLFDPILHFESAAAIHVGGTARAPGVSPCFDHQPGGSARQTHVFSHRHDIVAAQSFQEFEDLRGGKPAIQPNEDSGTREC